MTNAIYQQPFVSILTPVYNSEKYLEECIESVLAQTYDNWEYVIVNNCSTDNSLEIAQQYAQREERIRICNNEQFLDLMSNLNHAFRQISDHSTYCKVIHADDWLFPECIERMVSIGEEYPDAGIVSSYCLDENTVTHDGLPYPSHINSGREVCRRLLMDNFFMFSSPSTMLIRSDKIKKQDRMYDESHPHGDLSACFNILLESDFGFVHQVLTFVRRHNESATSKLNKFETYRLGNLKALLKHGPDFMSEDEMEKSLSESVDEYYSFLARKFYELKPREFWQFHFSELKALHLPIRYGKLAKCILLALLNLHVTMGRLNKALATKFSKKGSDNSSATAYRHKLSN